MQFSKEELKKLEQLSLIKLTEGEENVFVSKLEGVIDFLWKLNDIPIGVDKKLDGSVENSLIPISGVSVCEGSESLLKNVKHEIVNNSIVIKSVLSG